MKNFEKIRRVKASCFVYINENIDIYQVASTLGLKQTRKKGIIYSAYRNCPFHNERTDSLHFVKGRNDYHCFGCGAHGSVIDLVSKFYHWDNIRTIFWLKKNFCPDLKVEFENHYREIQENTRQKVFECF